MATPLSGNDQSLPPTGFCSAELVIGHMAEFGRTRVELLSATPVLALGLKRRERNGGTSLVALPFW